MVGKLRTFSYSWVYERTNVLVFALHIYPFHSMLQILLFRVMNTSIMGPLFGTWFLLKLWGPSKNCASGSLKVSFGTEWQ